MILYARAHEHAHPRAHACMQTLKGTSPHSFG